MVNEHADSRPWNRPSAHEPGSAEPADEPGQRADIAPPGADASRSLPPDPWLDSPEPGRPVDSPSVYDAGPQPWLARAPRTPAEMPTVRHSGTGSGQWAIPRIDPPQPAAPMPQVSSTSTSPAAGGYQIPRLADEHSPTAGPGKPQQAEPQPSGPQPAVSTEARAADDEPITQEPTGQDQPAADSMGQPPVNDTPTHVEPAHDAEPAESAGAAFTAQTPQHEAPAGEEPAAREPSFPATQPAPEAPAPQPQPLHDPAVQQAVGPSTAAQPVVPPVSNAPPVGLAGLQPVPPPEYRAQFEQQYGAPAQAPWTQHAVPPTPAPLDLSQAALVRPRKEEPTGGWRRALYKASFGGINPGISKEQAERNQLVERVRTAVDGCHKIAVVSLKGGIGKTTTTSCLGLTLAHYRGDRVVALDANPDAGTLAERLTGRTDVSVRHMLENLQSIDSFTDISRYMSLAGRLQVLASDQDAEISEAFDAEQYTRIVDLLGRFYNVVLTDSGTGMLHSAMSGTLEAANSLVVVGAPSVDGSSRAAKTLDWLDAHGHGELVASSVAVISSVRAKSEAVDMDVLRNHFSARCRAVVEIPYDPHLVVGGRIDMTQLKPETERAYLALAAAVADGFAYSR